MTAPGSELAAVRRMTNETTTAVFSDADIMDLMAGATDEDGFVNVNAAAAAVWRVKAGRYAELVDVSEAGSSRKFSDLHKNALTMAAKYEGLAAGVTVEGGAVAQASPRTRAIVRPEA